MVKRATAGPAIPKVGEGKRGREGYLSYLLRQASASTRLSLDRAMADLDVTLPQFSALMLINAYAPLSSADLARLAMLTPQTINVIVRNLEARAAIVRHAHEIHGRILTLEITPEGERLLARCRSRADRVEARLQALLPGKADGKVVRRWLVAVATTLAQEGDPVEPSG